MATGGVSSEEELYSFELFECSVCLESLINKQPRLLSCGHTFCTPCLQQLSRGNTVNCPKCRSPTQVPPGGVHNLPKNTDISKMKEWEQQLSARNEHFCQMCRKKDANVEFFCTACPRGQICQGCCNKHQIIPALKSHQIFPMEKTQIEGKHQEKCKQHRDLLEYFCPRCEEAICVTCTCDPQHEEHCDQIVDLKTGLKELKASMNELCETFKDNIKKVEICSEMLKQDVDSVKESKKNLAAQCQEMEKVLNQMKQQLQIITEFNEPLVSACQDVDIHLAVLRKQMSEFQNLNQATDGNFIQKSRECRLNCERIMFETEEILKRKLKIPENMKQNITITGEVVQVKTKDVCLKDKVESKVKHVKEQEIQTESEKEQKQGAQNPVKNEVKELDNIQLIREIKSIGCVYRDSRLEMVSVGDGTIILVISNLKYLQRINTEGNVVTTYQVAFDQQAYYTSACVYGNNLFVLTSDNVIVKISIDGSGCNINYTPWGVRTIGDLSAVEDNVILISEDGQDGRILEYNTETYHVIERVSGTAYPGKVSVLQDGQHTKYIVTSLSTSTSCSKWVVNIYNREWNLISTTNSYHDVLRVTPGGTLLFVYGNKIHEYSQDGSFIRELLDKYRFERIHDITWSGGCLWVLERYPCCIKIFMSN